MRASAGHRDTAWWALAAITGLLVVLTFLLGYYYQYTGLLRLRPAVIFALGQLCAVLVIVLNLRAPALHRRILYVLYLVGAVELGLQCLAWAGRLPAVSTYDFAPYARVYTRSGNSITNRWGWYAPRWERAAGARKIALIGDSYIHAPDIDPEEHMAVQLERRLRTEGRNVEVYPLGISGAGPAYYLEMLKYARQRLGVEEAVIFVTVINDFMNSSYELMNPWWDHSRYIYYTLDADGRVRFDPRSAPALYRLRREWELNHRHLLWSLGRTARSHFLLEKAAKQLLDRWRHGPAGAALPSAAAADIEIPLGGDKGLFETPRTPQVRRSIAIGTGLLRACRDYARAEGITLRLVAIPAVPLKFYEVYERRETADWRMSFGKYDFEALEALVAGFARSAGLPSLALGRRLRERRLSARQIRPLFFHGFAHFTPAGHRFVAEALYDSFFAQNARLEK